LFLLPVEAQNVGMTLTQSTLSEVVPSHWGNIRGVAQVSPGVFVLFLEDARGEIRLITVRQIIGRPFFVVAGDVAVIKRRP
jgi:hypothetical protein